MSRRWLQFSIRSLLLAMVVCAVAARFWPWPREVPLPASWFPLGDEVYHEQDRFAAQKKLLSFKSERRWFRPTGKLVDKAGYDQFLHEEDERYKAAGMMPPQGAYQQSPDGRYYVSDPLPHPDHIDDLPTTDQGATLSFRIEPTASSAELLFVLTLRGGQRAISREVEHRWTNTLPFLFAFIADGKPVTRDVDGFSKFGGATWNPELVAKHGQQTWKVRVNAGSIDALVRNPNVTTLQVVAAFAETQHEPYFAGDLLQHSVDVNEAETPPILIRSGVVRLQRVGGAWTVTQP